MFGHLPIIVKELVVNHGGNERWESIVKRLGFAEDFRETQIYDERIGEELINEAAKALNMRREAFLEHLGEAYLNFLLSKGHTQMLRVLGGTFYEFIQNLDFLHTVSMAKYPKADIPLFRMEETKSSLNKVRLHYYSRRDYLSRMVESLLRSVGRTIFKKDIAIQIISENFEDERYHVVYSVTLTELSSDPEVPPTMVAQTRKHGENQLHDIEVEHQKEKLEHLKMEFGEDALPVSKFRQQKAKHKSLSKLSMLYNKSSPHIPTSLPIEPLDFCEIFPFHILFDTSMNVKQAGLQIQAIIPEFKQENENICRHLDLVHPGRCEFSFHNIQKYICCPHVLKTKHNSLTNDYSQKGAVIYFRGQMIQLTQKHMILYLCSPYVFNLDTVEHFGMHISDIPTHDVTKYMFQGSDSTESFRRRTNKGDWLEGFLGSNGQAVFMDNFDDNSDEHKFSMVPKGVADMMKSGQKIEGRLYRNCSILFCDLVQFGMIVERCTPSEVLTLINDIHEKFDRLAQMHDVFKVDIIGDAYVIVSGIPNMVKNHAERIAKMSLAMLFTSKITPSPYNFGGNIGPRIMCRIGIHCGDVIGGVIGKPVHRFTVMGENVVLASRMESHGIPDRVHVSESAYNELKQYKFDFEPRGNIEIRGKGRMFTYILKDNDSTAKEILMGVKQSGVDGVALPMSADHQDHPMSASHNATKAHVPRHRRPKSGRYN